MVYFFFFFFFGWTGVGHVKIIAALTKYVHSGYFMLDSGPGLDSAGDDVFWEKVTFCRLGDGDNNRDERNELDLK